MKYICLCQVNMFVLFLKPCEIDILEAMWYPSYTGNHLKSSILWTMLHLFHSGNHVQLAYGRNHVTSALLETIWYLLYWKPWEIHCLLETIWNLLFTGNHAKSTVYLKPSEICCLLETMWTLLYIGDHGTFLYTAGSHVKSLPKNKCPDNYNEFTVAICVT